MPLFSGPTDKMSSQLSSKTTIAKNTTLLYCRTVLIMVVSLYTSRVILNALGVEDYGVYMAIGGVVSLLAVVSGPIDNAISRYLTYELGRDDKDRFRRYFSTGITVMLIFSVLVILILETAGLWFLNSKMVLDENRMTAANWVLHLSIASFVINMIASPYRATLIAHERMTTFAYIGIIDALIKLGVALLVKYSNYDKLIFYGVLMLVGSIIVTIIYIIICKREFVECRNPKVKIDRELFGDLFSFAGWNVFGAATMVCRGQGINILFNLFGGPVVNAAFGIANQVNSAIGNFVNNFTTALNPTIIKSYASAQKDYMMTLVYQGAKYTYFLVLFFALPLMLETKYVTKLWLGQTPNFSVPFIQLMLAHTLVESLSKTIMAGTHASGKIRKYQFVVGSMQILILPLAYIVLRLGFSPVTAFVAILMIDILALFVRILMARGIFSLSCREFVTKVLFLTTPTTLIAALPPLLCLYFMPFGIMRFSIVVVASLLSTSLAVLYVGCSHSERQSILSKVHQIAENHIHKNKLPK